MYMNEASKRLEEGRIQTYSIISGKLIIHDYQNRNPQAWPSLLALELTKSFNSSHWLWNGSDRTELDKSGLGLFFVPSYPSIPPSMNEVDIQS